MDVIQPVPTGLPRVTHVSPTYFAPESVVGGGERFAEELARAMAQQAAVKLVSFGPRALRERPLPSYERVILKTWTKDKMTPFSPHLLAELAHCDVVHCHQFHTLPTFLATLWGRLRGKRVFVSDLGGGGWTPGYQIDISRFLNGHLPISEYSARGLAGRNRTYRVIYGGVDLARYPLRARPEHDGSVVFLGRILPHKGVHHLIAGLPPDMPLQVVGSELDAEYLARLRALAEGKEVVFRLGLDDAQIVSILQRAMALVHPTPVDDRGEAGAAELFGLALVEAMACGCPVVASNAASLPEIVEDGASGILVPPNEPAAIRGALDRLRQDAFFWQHLSRGARAKVEDLFTWQKVAARCLAAYRDLGPRR
jgi:glycosyltransferase involved in cell wall biosynthesis